MKMVGHETIGDKGDEFFFEIGLNFQSFFFGKGFKERKFNRVVSIAAIVDEVQETVVVLNFFKDRNMVYSTI
jgi:hypothetical protein